MTWSPRENIITVSDSAVHLEITHAGNKKSAINIEERISVARRSSYSLINTGLHGTNVNGIVPKFHIRFTKRMLFHPSLWTQNYTSYKNPVRQNQQISHKNA